MTIPFAYKGEAMLVRWSETPKGRTVTLLLDPLVGDQHPFKFLKCGENGQRMQIAAALIGDDEKPAVPPTKKSPGSSNGRTPDFDSGNGGSSPSPGSKPKVYTRSQRAAIMCQDQDFQAWFASTLPGCWIGNGFDGDAVACDYALKERLGIKSKKELDTDLEAAARFDALRTDYELRDMVR